MKDLLAYQATLDKNLINAPLILYKYRSWSDEYHKKILYDNEIWFADPQTLNDPHDCNPPSIIDTTSLHTKENRYLITKIMKEENPNLNSEEIESYTNYFINEVQRDPQHYHQENYSLYSNTDYLELFGIFSTSGNCTNSQMWGLYGGNAKGVCIGFNTAKLYKAIPATLFSKVNYNNAPITNDILSDFGLERVIERFTRKCEGWNFEDEYRFIFPGFGYAFHQRNINFKSDCIEEIILGINMANDSIKEINDLAKIKYPNVPIFRIAKSHDTFGFKKERIN